MHCVKLHVRIDQIIGLLYRVGLWHRHDEPTASEARLKWFYSIYYLFFPISLIVGSITSDNINESIFLMETAFISITMAAKMYYIIWKKKEILKFLNEVCVYSIEDQENFDFTSGKVHKFMQFITALCTSLFIVAGCSVAVVPFLGSEKTLFFNIAFPLDYKHNELAFWMAFGFLFTEGILCSITLLFSLMTGYLLLHCALRYKVLGNRMRNMGVCNTVDSINELKVEEVIKPNLFYRDLIAVIKSYSHMKEMTHDLEVFLSSVFLVQLATSGLCICGSIYCLAFSERETLMEFAIYFFFLVYNIFDIFLVMYFGNEIKLSSDQLSYCLFESNWVDQSQSCKKCIIIFTEFIRQPQQLVILKIYPLTLETFIRIVNSAYSMFNILKTLA